MNLISFNKIFKYSFNFMIIMIFNFHFVNSQIFMDIKTNEILCFEDKNIYYSNGNENYIQLKIKSIENKEKILIYKTYFSNDPSKVFEISYGIGCVWLNVICNNPDGTIQNFSYFPANKGMTFNQILERNYIGTYKTSLYAGNAMEELANQVIKYGNSNSKLTKEKLKIIKKNNIINVEYSVDGTKFVNCKIQSGSLQEGYLKILIPNDKNIYKINLELDHLWVENFNKE